MLALKGDIKELYSRMPGNFCAPLSFYAEPPSTVGYLFTRDMTSSVLLQASFACLSILQLYGSAWMWLWICSHACLYHECLLIPCSGGIKWHDGSAAGGWCTTAEWEFVLGSRAVLRPCSCRAALHSVHLSSAPPFSTFPPLPLLSRFCHCPCLPLSIIHSIISPLLCITPRLPLAGTSRPTRSGTAAQCRDH